VRIEVWSDFTCPSCYIGKKTLEAALDIFGKDKHVYVEYKSFQLDSEVKQSSPDKLLDILQRRDQLSLAKTEEMKREIEEQASSFGLAIDVNSLLYTDTNHAHRLVKLAEKENKAYDIIERLFHAYLVQRRNIGEKSVLLSVAKDVGLDEEEVTSLLSFNKYARAVADDQDVAQEMGIEAVPFFIFHDRYAISGSQPISVFLNVLQEIWEEDATCYERRDVIKGDYCIGNDCEE